MCGRHRSTRGPRGDEEEEGEEGKRGLRTEAKVRGGCSLCYGISVHRGGKKVLIGRREERKVSEGFNVPTPKEIFYNRSV